MVEVNAKYEGGLHCTVVHKPSGSVIETDAPVDNKGKGEKFSPTDLLAAAISTCWLTTMAIAAEEREIDMTGTTCRVEKHMSTDKPRRIVKLAGEITFTKDIPLAKRGLLEAAALNCPITKSVHPDLEIDIKFHFPDGQDTEAHTHRG